MYPKQEVQVAQQFITYYRVSTQRQGASGLGLEAQRSAVLTHLAGSDKTVIEEFLEVETGKGSNALEKRPQLRLALERCRKTGATLLIAKLDRLARNVHFVSGLIETGVDFVAADMPHANKVMIQMHAVMSEWERDQISERTRAALAAAKARGVVLGATGPQNLQWRNGQRQHEAHVFRERLQPVLTGFLSQGLSRRAIVARLNDLGVKTPMGGIWSYAQVQRITTAVIKPAARDPLLPYAPRRPMSTVQREPSISTPAGGLANDREDVMARARGVCRYASGKPRLKDHTSGPDLARS